MNEDTQQEPYFFLHQAEEINEAYPDIINALGDIIQYSPTGKRLLEWAANNDVALRQSTQLSENNHGSCDIRSNAITTVTVNAAESAYFIFLLTHEISHAYQHGAHDYFRYFNRADMPLTHIIAGHYYAEAGANAMAARILFEMKQNGAPEAFSLMCEDSKSFGAYCPIFIGYEVMYDTAKKQGHEEDISHRLAAQLAFKEWFSEKNLQFYAENVIYGFLDKMYSKTINYPEARNTLSFEFLKYASQFDGNKSILAHDEELASPEDIFHGHQDLIWLCQAIELERDKRASIRNCPKIVQKRMDLINSGNIFAGLDILRFFNAMKYNNERPAHEQLYITDIAHFLMTSDIIDTLPKAKPQAL